MTARQLPQAKYIKPVRHLFLICMVFPVSLLGQVTRTDSSGRNIPGCAKERCLEGLALVTSLDTLLRMTPSCEATPPAVLRSLHLAPYTEVGEIIVGGEPNRWGLPSSPAVLRIENLNVDYIARYWPDIRVVEAGDVERGALASGTCLFVFSPATWLGRDSIRIIVSEVRQQPFRRVQRFIFLRREPDGWIVTEVETGMQS